MANYKDTLAQLYKNLNILRERESKYGGNAPLDLLSQIEDHQTAITLTEQLLAGDLSEAEWREAMEPLLVEIRRRTGEAAVTIETQINIIHHHHYSTEKLPSRPSTPPHRRRRRLFPGPRSSSNCWNCC